MYTVKSKIIIFKSDVKLSCLKLSMSQRYQFRIKLFFFFYFLFFNLMWCLHECYPVAIYNIIKCKSVINVQCWLRKAFLASFDVIADEYLVFSSFRQIRCDWVWNWNVALFWIDSCMIHHKVNKMPASTNMNNYKGKINIKFNFKEIPKLKEIFLNFIFLNFPILKTWINLL